MSHSTTFLACAALIGVTAALAAQDPRPTFDVVSVRKSVESDGPPGAVRTYPLDSEIYEPPNATVESMLTFAYDLSWSQVDGGPEWITRDHYDVRGQSAQPTSADEKRLMVQSLLADRFGLVVHMEQRQVEFGSLVLARGDGRPGPGLTPCDDPTAIAGMTRVPRGGRLSVRRCAEMSDVAGMVAGNLGIPVVDRTGLAGLWNLVLTYASDRTLPAGLEPEPGLVSFPTALEEQLGLKVEAGVGPLDVLVIDAVERPTEN